MSNVVRKIFKPQGFYPCPAAPRSRVSSLTVGHEVKPLGRDQPFAVDAVPGQMVHELHRGDTVTISCDGCRSDIAATISFVSPQAEYTPPVIYSDESRSKLVYLIEARPAPEEAARFNPGQPVTVAPAAKKARS